MHQVPCAPEGKLLTEQVNEWHCTGSTLKGNWMKTTARNVNMYFQSSSKNQIYQGCISGFVNYKLQWLKYLHVHVINFWLLFYSRTTIFLLVQSLFTLLSNHALFTEIIRSYIADIFIQKQFTALLLQKKSCWCNMGFSALLKGTIMLGHGSTLAGL